MFNHTAYLSLGTNIGDRQGHLKDALQLLDSSEGIRVEIISSIYETDPVGFTDQNNFLNIAVKITTKLNVEPLLGRCLAIEEELGRVREFRWGPRIIDLDILLYNQDNIESEKLIVPHPRMHERAFVIIPLLEIDSTLRFPLTGMPLEELLQRIQGREGVRLWKQISGDEESVLFES